MALLCDKIQRSILSNTRYTRQIMLFHLRVVSIVTWKMVEEPP